MESKKSLPMDESPVIGFSVCTKISGITTGKTLQVARRKCVAKGCFNVQSRNNFGNRLTL